MYKSYLLGFLCVLSTHFSLLAQEKLPTAEADSSKIILRIKDDPEGRGEYEKAMLVNPLTREIPRGVLIAEQQFARSSQAKLSKKASRSSSQITWINRGPYNVGGRTRALALDKLNENIIFAGGVSGGLWRSTDAGESWEQITPPQERPSITSIAQDTRTGQTNTWYYTTGEGSGNSARGGQASYNGHGVYKSTDNGITWTLLASTNTDPTVSYSGDFQYCWRVVVSPVNGDVYVATYTGIFRSTDGGLSWTKVLNGLVDIDTDNIPDAINQTDVVISSSGILYATIGSSSNFQKGIFRSVDGVQWTTLTQDIPNLPTNYNRIVLGIAPSNENIVYVFANTPSSGTNDHKFWKYTFVNAEGTGSSGVWEDRTTNLPAYGGLVGNLAQGTYNQFVIVKPDDENFVLIGSTNLYSSADGFATNTKTAWIGGYAVANDVSKYPQNHPDQHALVFLPSNPKKAINAHDGGLSVTEDITKAQGEVHWKYLNYGYFTTQAYSVGIDEQTAGDNRIMAGFQDNGKWTATTGAAKADWIEEIGGGDGAYVSVVPGQDIRYTSTQFGKIIRANGANPENPTNFVYVHPSNARGQLFIHPYILDPDDANKMFYPARNGSFGNQGIWRNSNLAGITSTNSNGTTTNWNFLSPSQVTDGSQITALAAAKGSNELYYGTSTGQLYKIPDRTLAPASIVKEDIFTGKGLPTGYISAIAIDPTDANNIFVVFSNYQLKSIWHSQNKGSTWANISGNLEQNTDGSGNGPSVRWIAVHAPTGGTKGYFVGTSTGLYYTENLNGTSTTWIQQSPELIGNKVVTMIKTRQADGLVAVATHANGIYSAFYGINDQPPLVKTQIKPIEVFQDDQPTVLNITNTFTDPDNDDNAISVEISNNTNATLVNATLSSGKLTLNYQSGKAGEAYITLRATSNGKTVEEIVYVKVLPTNFPLFDQISTVTNGNLGYRVGVYTDNSYYVADNFVIPEGYTWYIEKVEISSFAGGTGSADFQSVDVYFYQNGTNIPATLIASQNILPANVSNLPPNTSPTLITLNTPINLSAGTYWLRISPNFNNTADTYRFVWYYTETNGDAVYVTPNTAPIVAGSAVRDFLFNIYGTATTTNNLAEPSNLVAQAISNTDIKLQWQDNTTNELGFKIYRASTSNGSFQAIATVGKNTTEYIDKSGLTTGNTYFYKIKTFDIAQESGFSNEVSAKPDIIPDKPTNLQANIPNNASVVLNWIDNSANETGFEVLRTTVQGKGYAKIGSVNANQTTFTDSFGLITGVNYFYVVRAIASQGKSNYSNEVAITAGAITPTSSPTDIPTITSFTPNTGELGTNVTIIGTNFSEILNNNQIKFNGVPATIISATETTLNTAVPNGATTGKITVTVNGKTATSSTNFTVNTPNNPVIDAPVSPIVTSIENTQEALVKIFPNPANQYFQVLIANVPKQEAKASLYDLQGTVLQTQIMAYENSSLSAAFYVQNFPTGVYLLKIAFGKENMWYRIIVQ